MVCFLLLISVISLSSAYQNLTLVDDFIYNDSIGRDFKVIVVAKGFRQLERNFKESVVKDLEILQTESKMMGRSRPRVFDRGVVVGVSLNEDRINFNSTEWKIFLRQPSGIDIFENKLIVAAGKFLEEIDVDRGSSRTIRNKWFHHLHSVFYNSDGTKCLIASTGSDMIIEYDLVHEKIIWDWSPWEHGFDTSSRTGLHYTRSEEKYNELVEIFGEESVFLFDPEEEWYQKSRGISTLDRPCQLNCAKYWNEEEEDGGKIIGVTFGHKNLSLTISRETGEIIDIVTESAVFPHSFAEQDLEIPCRGYIVADSKGGSIIFLDQNYEICMRVYIDKGMTDRVSGRSGQYWVQSVNHLKGGIFAVVDSYWGSLFLLDISKKEYRKIRYPEIFSVQEVRLVEDVPLFEKLSVLFGRDDSELVVFTDVERNLIKEDITNVEVNEVDRTMDKYSELQILEITEYEYEELKDVVNGKYYPLKGFMTEKELDCVLERKYACKQNSNTVVKSVNRATAENLRIGEEVRLISKGEFVGILRIDDIFDHDRHRHSFLLEDSNSRVSRKEREKILEMGEFLVGGSLLYFQLT